MLFTTLQRSVDWDETSSVKEGNLGHIFFLVLCCSSALSSTIQFNKRKLDSSLSLSLPPPLQNLLALRAQDRKSNKRVRAMINMNKGASKAVLDDAKVGTRSQAC